MSNNDLKTENKVALITGAARRIGAEIARTLHRNNFNIVVHYNTSKTDAATLAAELNSARPESAVCLQADLCDLDSIRELAKQSLQVWQRMDALINNASTFYPTLIGEIGAEHWDDLIGSNVKAPLFLSQALTPALNEAKGCIVNIADIHGERPLAHHTVYCIAKAGNVMLTKSLAKELGPSVRVNGIAPGAILWPEDDAELDQATKEMILDRTALRTLGTPVDIAKAIKFLLCDAPYVTGQIIAVDGGRSLVS